MITYTDEDGDPNPITPVVLASNTKIADGTVDLDNDGDLDDGVTLQEVIENGFEMKRSLAYLKIRIQA